MEAIVYWKMVLNEVLGTSRPSVNFVDSKSLWENLQSKKSVHDRLLRVDIKSMKQNSVDNDIAVEWIESEKNLSDVLTKHGVRSDNLLSVLQSAKLPKQILYGKLR